MGARNTLTLNINLTVDDETAKRAVYILNMYLQDTGRKPEIEECSSGDRRNYYRISMIF